MITIDNLNKLKTSTEQSLAYSERVLNGDSEYDEADADRKIKNLCLTILDLIKELSK